jgi:hypothetical protein
MSHVNDQANAPDTYEISAPTWTKVRNSMTFVALVGWLSLAAAFAVNREQFHFSYLVAFLYCVSIGLGAMFYVMVQHLTGSAWSVTVRRLMENLMRTLPLTGLLFIPVALGIHSTFEWSHAAAQADPVIAKKLGYLNEPFFIARAYIVIAIWSLFAWRLYAISRQQDATGSLVLTRRAEKWSAPGLFLLFLTASVAAFDWLMSLSPEWFSTMFGVYFLAGGAVGFMALLILICLSLRSAGYLVSSVSEEHYHDLGKWLFALVVFWGYVAFSQYMLIWYGNLPEEGVWYLNRLHGSWSWWMYLQIFGNFAIPFVFLLPRGSKRNLSVLGFFASWMLVFHYVDLYWLVMPVLHKSGFSPSWMDAAAMLALVPSYGLVFWSGLKQKPLVPVGDPRLQQSLAFHNA